MIFHGTPSSPRIRSAAVDFVWQCRPSISTSELMGPCPQPHLIASSLPISDCRVANRNRPSRSWRATHRTVPLHREHSPSTNTIRYASKVGALQSPWTGSPRRQCHLTAVPYLSPPFGAGPGRRLCRNRPAARRSVVRFARTQPAAGDPCRQGLSGEEGKPPPGRTSDTGDVNPRLAGERTGTRSPWSPRGSLGTPVPAPPVAGPQGKWWAGRRPLPGAGLASRRGAMRYSRSVSPS